MLTSSVPRAARAILLLPETLHFAFCIKGCANPEEPNLMLFKQAFPKFMWPEKFSGFPPQVAPINIPQN